MTKNIAIIPARGGSKRIPRKNIKEFLGFPIIKYAINAAMESEIFDTLMVSTNDSEISKISKFYGAEVPFMRSAEASSDYATTLDVLMEVIDQYKNIGVEYEILCCIYPCVPFLRKETLQKAYEFFLKSDCDWLMPIVKYSHPIQRALKINNEDYLEYAYPEFMNSRSQDLESMYHDVGMFYFHRCSSLNKKIKKLKYIIMNEEETQDIDTEDDWFKAELKYKILKENSFF